MKSRTVRRTLTLCSAIGLLAIHGAALAQGSTSNPAARDYRMHFEVNLGLDNWSSLADLRLGSGGKFHRRGLGIGGGVHWKIGERERGAILAGFDTYVFTDDSSVRYITDNITADGILLTPSVRFQFDDGEGPRVMLGAGVGYYEAEITEVTSFWFGEQNRETLWDDSSLGMWLGFDVEFPRRPYRRDRGFFVSTRIHEFDFGTVRDETGQLSGFGTLGQNAGQLTGPMIAVHFGHHWLH